MTIPDSHPAPATSVDGGSAATAKKMIPRLTWLHYAAIGGSLSLVVTLGWFWITDPVATADRVWFYDMKTGALFPGPSTSIPPIAAPSDGAGPDRSGVVAQVIHLDGDSVPQIVALQSYTLDAQKLRQGLNAGNEAAKPRNDNEGTLVATPPAKVGDPIVWVKLSSNEGLGVMMRVTQMVGEKKYHTDLP